MPPENIDDLFRDHLEGHATPPPKALWARLQAAPVTPDPAAERLDQLFQQKLNGHATVPGRELWERLEDEHLRPRPRRAPAWWPVALAAAVALLLVAGGAGLWRGFPAGNARRTTAATPPAARPARAQVRSSAPLPQRGTAARLIGPEGVAGSLLGDAPLEPSAVIQKNNAARATRRTARASTAPKARVAASQQLPRYAQETTRRPDAATGRLALVARAAADAAPEPSRPTAADERRQAGETAPPVAAAPRPAAAAEIVPATPTLTPTLGLASVSGVITVDVRAGDDPVAGSATSLGAARAAAPGERRRLGGRLLQQAGHLVRGERVSLAEVTGLPENVTLRATVGGRSLTKSIQL
ncbi:hypothetical protein [Hymenobacter sp.]|uniref:hypothetical protein n=1 Tax=Hymenobacter sp. TaxID=1898978 RepID=UPI00286AF282|nr:hypothetical protein [Hymenobacter sp.]